MPIKWSCNRCKFSEDCKQPILHGNGELHPDVMVIGDSPDTLDDRQGEAFSGKTGLFVRNLLEKVSEGRTIFYTNAVRCKPPPDKKINKGNIDACNLYLLAEIKRVQPKCILLFGSSAVHALFGKIPMKKVRGRRLFWNGIPIVATFSPKFVVDYTKDLTVKKQWRDDIFLAFSDAATDVKTPDIDVVSIDEFRKQVREWAYEKFIAFDIEASGLNPYSVDAKIYCVSASNGTSTVVVDLTEAEPEEIRSVALALSRCNLIAHHAKYDVKYIRVLCGVNLFPKIVGCTLLEAYALDERQELGLKPLVSQNIPEYSGFETEIMEEGAYGEGGFSNVPLPKLLQYNGMDSFVCWHLHDIFIPQLTEKQIDYVNDVLLDGTEMLVNMECTGAAVSVPRIKRLTVKVTFDLMQSEKKILNSNEASKFRELHDREPKLTGPKDKIQLLYDIPKIKPKHFTNRKRTQASTKKEHIEKLGTPLSKLFVVHSTIQKVHTTYTGQAALNWIQPDGYVHSSFGFNAWTGRLSSEGPNLQNQLNPKKGHKYNTRSYFISRFGNGDIVSADYKAIELRIFALITKARFFVDVFKQKRDPHAEMAARIFGKNVHNINSDEREEGKTCNFELLYESSAYGMSQEHGKSENYWQKMINEWTKVVSEVLDYRQNIRHDVINKGFVESFFGARRHFDWDRNLSRADLDAMLREAGNHPIQNTASNITVTAAIEVDRYLRRENYRSRIINLVHDNILLDHNDREPDVAEIVREIMEGVDFEWLKVEIPVDVTTTPSWGGH